jgi:hypothetical protein
MSEKKPPRVGRCTLCSLSVYRREGGTQEYIRQNGRFRQHRHEKPFTLTSLGPGPAKPWKSLAGATEPEEYRYWHDQAPWFLR